MYYLFNLTKDEAHFAVLRFLALSLAFFIATSNISLLDLLPNKLSFAGFYNSSQETPSSCGMACCAGKTEPSACCSVNPSKKTSPSSDFCHQDSFIEENTLTESSCHTSDSITDQELFWELNASFFADYYLAKEEEATKNFSKSFFSSKSNEQILPVLGQACPCDNKSFTTQFRLDAFLSIFVGNLQTRPPTSCSKFDLYLQPNIELFAFSSTPSRAPPSYIS